MTLSVVLLRLLHSIVSIICNLNKQLNNILTLSKVQSDAPKINYKIKQSNVNLLFSSCI